MYSVQVTCHAEVVTTVIWYYKAESRGAAPILSRFKCQTRVVAFVSLTNQTTHSGRRLYQYCQTETVACTQNMSWSSRLYIEHVLSPVACTQDMSWTQSPLRSTCRRPSRLYARYVLSPVACTQNMSSAQSPVGRICLEPSRLYVEHVLAQSPVRRTCLRPSRLYGGHVLGPVACTQDMSWAQSPVRTTCLGPSRLYGGHVLGPSRQYVGHALNLAVLEASYVVVNLKTFCFLQNIFTTDRKRYSFCDLLNANPMTLCENRKHAVSLTLTLSGVTCP